MFRFPFGLPLRRVEQVPHSKARVFVLGVYSSAVHARWLGPDGKQRVAALAVASEPCIFWRGEGAQEIVQAIHVPLEAGRLVVSHKNYNGPSGKSLDDDYLAPLGLSRDDAWLCDLLPESRMNSKQADKVLAEYAPLARSLGLPAATIPRVPPSFADRERAEAIQAELLSSGAETLVTLGDAPLREFVAVLGRGHSQLRAYGAQPDLYGKLHPLIVGGRRLQLLPLTHPRQTRGLGASNQLWRELHRHWKQQTAAHIASSLGLDRLR